MQPMSDRCVYIYQIMNKIDGKVYIGSTLYIDTRFAGHKKSLRRGLHHSIYLQRAWDKYGEENFTLSILRTCPEGKRNDYEQHSLNTHRAWNPKYGYNMNRRVDSRYGRSMSIEARQKMSLAKKGKPGNNKGYKFTEEQSKRLSLAHIGIKLSEETKRKIGAASKGNTYRLGHKASEETRRKLSKSRIGKPGKIASLETRLKMSQARKGVRLSVETRKKMSIARKLWHHNRRLGKVFGIEEAPCKPLA